jgi:hypothetical protein
MESSKPENVFAKRTYIKPAAEFLQNRDVAYIRVLFDLSLSKLLSMKS